MSTAPENIEHFNRVVLELLIRLYESFPRPINIDSQTAADIGFGLVSSSVPDMESSSVAAIADDIMEWLKEEGFIRYDPDANYRPGTFWKVRLTLKGFTVLAYSLASFQVADTEAPLIQKAKEVMLSAGSSSQRHAIAKVVGEIFKQALTKEDL